MNGSLLKCLAAVVVVLSLGREAPAVTIVSNGYVVPETISQAPAAFGNYGGSYFIPDAATGQIMVMPAGFGSPTVFQTATQDITGGLFLPAGFGAQGGQLIVVGRTKDTFVGQITAYDPNGNGTVFGTSPGNGGLAIPAIAPDNFGSYGGQLFVTDGGGVSVFDQTGAFTSFVPVLPIRNAAFGVVFAPDGFGLVGGTLLVDNAGNVGGQSEILSLDTTGNITRFASIDLLTGQVGLRQMAFAPSDFGRYGGDLFVSVTGSTGGRGSLGSVLVLDSTGKLMATLKLGTEFDKFDPRGLLFLPGGELLISDSSDPILLASSADFQPTATPEPSSLVLMVSTGFLAIVWRSRRRAAAPGRG